jgi:hypothetical protein
MDRRTLLAASTFIAAAPLAAAGSGVGPDITADDISSAMTFGAAGDIHAYALGVTACNAGDEPLDWVFNSVRHPAFATQLYSLSEGRFEQIGLSWVFHEFFPLEINLCGGNCTPSGDQQSLGADCGSVNSAGIAGVQSNLGPRTEVNPAAGVFNWPPTDFNLAGDAVYKRLQARRDDLQTPGARFFFEVQYVALDDSEAGNALNNVSHRETAFTPATLSPMLTGDNVAERPAIYAWAEADPDVFVGEAIAPDGGRYIVASKATAIPGGPVWRYEYAVYNQNSDRAAVAFEAPHPGRTDFPRAFDFGFHDVDYHSGDPIDGTDWPGTEATFDARWEVQQPAPISLWPNEIRWGTLYNFRFTSNSAPVETTVRHHGVRRAWGQPDHPRPRARRG